MSGREQARRFLEALYGDRPGLACLAVGRHPYRSEAGKYHHKDWQEEFYSWPAQADSLLNRVLGAVETADVYVSVLLRSSRSRKAKTALPSRWLWSELDAPPTDEALLARLLERGGMVVDSGSLGHQHVYVRLTEDAPVDVLSGLSRRLKVALGGDHKHDAAVVLRVPGTFNHKARVNGEEATAVRLVSGDMNGDPG